MDDRRPPCVADRFYPGDPGECRDALEQMLSEAAGPPAGRGSRGTGTPGTGAPGTGAPVAGIVPHAGWVFSGPTAARVFASVPPGRAPGTVVLLGTVHVRGVRGPSLYAHGSWQTPLGDVAIDEELAAAILARGEGLVLDAPAAHAREHSIEVQVPFVRHLWPEARIVPLMVPPDGSAPRVGEVVAAAVGGRDDVWVVGSTDLTHYGPSYGFTPAGRGERALAWVRERNDAAMLERIEGLRAEDVVPEARRHGNACGPGAIAAVLAYARARGATEGVVVDYTTSHDVLPRGVPTDFVGYVGAVFRRP